MVRRKASKPESVVIGPELLNGDSCGDKKSLATAKPNARQLLRHGAIKALAKELDRPERTLIALAPHNDPFSITPARVTGAKWLAQIWKHLAIGAGELSQTRCMQLVERAEESGLPVRIITISDFDMTGRQFALSVARKIEHRLALKGLDLDIQVRQIALTLEQCQKYRLPRTPIKKTDLRAAEFEGRFGKGATELDAMEALHPGELRKIIDREIERYFDPNLDDRIDNVVAETQQSISAINRKVHAEHSAEIKRLAAEWTKIGKEYARQIASWQKLANVVWQAVTNDLEAKSPDIDEIEWPEPDEGDEDPDPLFDSTRDYVEQIGRYKEHQGKPTTRRGGGP